MIGDEVLSYIQHTLSEFVGNTAQLLRNQSRITNILPHTGHPGTFCVTRDGHEEKQLAQLFTKNSYCA